MILSGNFVKNVATVAAALALVAFGGTMNTASAQAPAATPPAITLAQAKTMVDAAEAEARANNWNMTMIVTDAAGVPIYVRRMDNASPRSWDIGFAKAKTVVATGMSTIEYGQGVQNETIQPIEGGITFEGGLPIFRGTELIGAFGTSGARAEQDAQVSRAGIAALK